MNPTFLSTALVCALLAATPAPADAPPFALRAENRQPKGWGADGWGSYRFLLRNDSPGAATIVKWTAHWEAKGKRIGEPWGGEIDEALSAGKEATRDEVGVLPEAVAKAAKPDAPVMAGSFFFRRDGETIEVPFRLEIPEAVLPEPLRRITGKTVGLELMESRFKNFKHLDRTLRWTDECYSAMTDLTGERPFGGKRMIFKEAPAHPWWAYAGREMILNTDYVEETVKDFDRGILSFGWIHEVGHNFDDVLGKWYIWSGPAAEFQANFKLAYAVENVPDRSFRIRWEDGAPAYGGEKRPEALLTGPELTEKFFLLFGDPYLADSKRNWDTLSSDEIHAFFQRLQRVYGWDVFKRWYRTYRKLEEEGRTPPEKPEEKISLIAAILSAETRVDLVPVFQMWRFPVTEASAKAMSERYSIGL
jgi:hypothetical protein